MTKQDDKTIKREVGWAEQWMWDLNFQWTWQEVLWSYSRLVLGKRPARETKRKGL